MYDLKQNNELKEKFSAEEKQKQFIKRKENLPSNVRTVMKRKIYLRQFIPNANKTNAGTLGERIENEIQLSHLHAQAVRGNR